MTSAAGEKETPPSSGGEREDPGLPFGVPSCRPLIFLAVVSVTLMWLGWRCRVRVCEFSPDTFRTRRSVRYYAPKSLSLPLTPPLGAKYKESPLAPHLRGLGYLQPDRPERWYLVKQFRNDGYRGVIGDAKSSAALVRADERLLPWSRSLPPDARERSWCSVMCLLREERSGEAHLLLSGRGAFALRSGQIVVAEETGNGG